ncbi:MAG: hypothetical protein ACUVRR_13535, partial [Candidatus Fervidibacter sp.]|uniref:hypothetical protein n=1 Tax=Candidatus Fervidibacter sp. TaxID=3100871 RepID=UPI004049A1E8
LSLPTDFGATTSRASDSTAPSFAATPSIPLLGCPAKPDTRELGTQPDAACRSGSAPGHCLCRLCLAEMALLPERAW